MVHLLTDNPSYSFQDIKLLFCRSFVHISEMCIWVEFWFLIIHGEKKPRSFIFFTSFHAEHQKTNNIQLNFLLHFFSVHYICFSYVLLFMWLLKIWKPFSIQIIHFLKAKYYYNYWWYFNNKMSFLGHLHVCGIKKVPVTTFQITPR